MSCEALRWAMHGPKGLDMPERLVLLVLADHANLAHEARPSVQRIAEISGGAKRTVQRALARLRELGLVEAHEQCGQPTVYSLAIRPETRTKPRAVRGSSAASGVRQSDAPTPVTVTQRQSDAPTPATVTPKESTNSKPNCTSSPSTVPLTPKAKLWQVGLQALMDLTRMPEREARRMLGKMRERAGEDDQRLLQILVDAQRRPPVDPVSWVMKLAADPPAPLPAPEQAPPARRGRDYGARFFADEDRKRPWWDELVTISPTNGVACVGDGRIPCAWEVDKVEDQVLEAAGLPWNWPGSTEAVMRWLVAGADLQDDILPAIRRAAQRPDYRPPASSLAYFTKAISIRPPARRVTGASAHAFAP